MLARILTENKNYQGVIKIVKKYFNGATITKADGLWQGKIEHTLIIDVCMGSGISHIGVEKLAYEIKKMNKQEAILVQYLQCESKLI